MNVEEKPKLNPLTIIFAIAGTCRELQIMYEKARGRETGRHTLLKKKRHPLVRERDRGGGGCANVL